MATYRQRAWNLGLDHRGYVTTIQARAAGIPAVELAKISSRGLIRHVAHGIYHFDEFPTSGLDQFYEAQLRVGGDAYLVGDAVLALFDLADVNPTRLRVATSQRRVRKDLPNWIVVQQSPVPGPEVIEVEGIRTSTLLRALIDSSTYVMHDRLLEAAELAARRDLLSPREVASLSEFLGGGGA